MNLSEKHQIRNALSHAERNEEDLNALVVELSKLFSNNADNGLCSLSKTCNPRAYMLKMPDDSEALITEILDRYFSQSDEPDFVWGSHFCNALCRSVYNALRRYHLLTVNGKPDLKKVTGDDMPVHKREIAALIEMWECFGGIWDVPDNWPTPEGKPDPIYFAAAHPSAGQWLLKHRKVSGSVDLYGKQAWKME